MPDFYTWPFPSLGSTFKRTLPARLSDTINVKDWGAVGDNSTNDAPAIQAAIDYLIDTKGTGGTVFFPVGFYRISAPLVVGHNSLTTIGVRLVGSGYNGTQLLVTGGYTNTYGYMISKGAKTNDCIEGIEELGGISARLRRDNVSVISCLGSFHATEARGAWIQNCNSTGSTSNADVATGSEFPGMTANSVFVGIGTGVVKSCRFTGGAEVGYALSGNGSVCIGCSIEVAGAGVRVGWGIPDPIGAPNTWGEVASYGAVVMGLETEAVFVAIDLWNANSCLVAGNWMAGGLGLQQNGGAITNITWSATAGGTADVTTPGHNIPLGAAKLQFSQSLFTGTNAAWWPTPNGALNATVTSTTHFTYPLTSNPASAFVAGVGPSDPKWTYPLRAAIRCRIANNCMITSNHCAMNAVAGVNLDGDGTSAVAHTNNYISAISASSGWVLPSNHVKNLAAWKFELLDGSANWWDPAIPTRPQGTMVYADLPDAAHPLVGQPGPFEGQEYDIVDGALAGGGTAVFDSATQGAGSQHIKVRYDGVSAKWKRIG